MSLRPSSKPMPYWVKSADYASWRLTLSNGRVMTMWSGPGALMQSNGQAIRIPAGDMRTAWEDEEGIMWIRGEWTPDLVQALQTAWALRDKSRDDVYYGANT